MAIRPTDEPCIFNFCGTHCKATGRMRECDIHTRKQLEKEWGAAHYVIKPYQ